MGHPHDPYVDDIVAHYNGLSQADKNEVYKYVDQDHHHGVVGWIKGTAIPALGIYHMAEHAGGLATLFIKRFRK